MHARTSINIPSTTASFIPQCKKELHLLTLFPLTLLLSYFLTKEKGHQASTRHPKNPKKPIENYILTVIINRKLSFAYKGTKYNIRTSTFGGKLISQDFLSFDNRLYAKAKWHVAISNYWLNFVTRGDAQIERAFVLIWVFMTIWTSFKPRITSLIFYVGS